MIFQSRLPSWIILCSVWLFRFAHTGEAQAAKEGKVMRKNKSLVLFIAFEHEVCLVAQRRTCLPLQAACQLPIHRNKDICF